MKFSVKYIFLLLVSAALYFPRTGLADAGDSCHFHGKKEATEETIIRCSLHHRKRLAKKGAVDSSWTTLSHDSIEKVKNPKGRQEWKITFTHPSQTDDSKRKLFIFFSHIGNFVAANHTGK